MTEEGSSLCKQTNMLEGEDVLWITNCSLFRTNFALKVSLCNDMFNRTSVFFWTMNRLEEGAMESFFETPQIPDDTFFCEYFLGILENSGGGIALVNFQRFVVWDSFDYGVFLQFQSRLKSTI